MLSPTTHAVPIPGLEILANDVRCTHGATVGRVDREQLFYLMARGLPRTEAERLIVRLGDVEPIGAAVISYVNRLSDALFVMGRHATRLYGEPEPLWTPEKT